MRIIKKHLKTKKGKSSTDVLLRDLDCAVIEQIHIYNNYECLNTYDSARGTFSERSEVYPGSACQENHTRKFVL